APPLSSLPLERLNQSTDIRSDFNSVARQSANRLRCPLANRRQVITLHVTASRIEVGHAGSDDMAKCRLAQRMNVNKHLYFMDCTNRSTRPFNFGVAIGNT